MSYADSQDGTFSCPRCGTENFEYASFCLSCGLSFDDPESEGTPAGTYSDDLPEGIDYGAQSTGEHRPRWTASKLRVAEAAAGLLLVLLVAGYALFNWQQGTHESDAYHSAVAAEQNRDWDRALAGFRDAGNLLDAPRRLANAEQKIQQRDLLYAQAIADEKKGDWKGEVSKLQELAFIQPGFKDSATLLAKAWTQAFGQSLSGLVYQVEAGPGAGLYIWDPSGRSKNIPGTDRRSTVRAVSSDGRSLLFDRAARADEQCPSNSVPASNPTAIPGGPPGDQSRVISLLTIGPTGVLSDHAFPCLGTAGTGTFAEHGFWWADPPTSSDSSSGEVFFPDSTSNVLVRVTDASAGKLVLALDPVRSQVLISQSSGAVSNGTRVSELYTASAGGLNLRLVRVVEGVISEASFSKDGRWILYSVQGDASLNNGPLTFAFKLPDASAAVTSPVPYSDVRLLSSALETPGRSPELALSLLLDTTFGEEWAALATRSGQKENLRVFDLDEGRIAFDWTREQTGSFVPQLAGISPDGQYLAFRDQDGSQAVLSTLSLHSSPAWSTVRLDATPQQSVRIQFVPDAPFALISVMGAWNNARGGSSLYVSQLSEAGLVSPRLLAATDRPELPGVLPVALIPGAYAVAYISPGDELHMVFLDGTNDSLLARGVGGVWSLPGIDLSSK